ncbi:ABC exporter membrane fusion protein [Gloeocapsa sp. PCC 73106]|uniref:ABC exporter membrane fusion protein n=1 Tax=Gloeocapsa sp. PCC 73106 TaxID=102232 RepID=UPI0002E34907|nr:ABC exporter membrane fusion protein [Gloeocapsa sp. PCC 73106]
MATTTGIFAFPSLQHTQTARQNSPETFPDNIPAVTTITSLGRIAPQEKVTRLSATIPFEGARVEQLLVKKGDVVKAGQIIAILDSRDRQLAALKRDQEQVKVAQARLEQVKAGAKTGAIKAQLKTIERFKAELRGQIVAQEAKIANLQARLQGEKQAQEAKIKGFKAQLKNAQTECSRYEKLYRDGAVSASEYDSRCLEEDTFREQLNEAEANLLRIITTLSEEINEAQAILTRTVVTLQKQIIEAEATLEEIAEVRPVDVQVAQAEVDKAMAMVKQAEADLELAYVRAPINGRILEVHIRPGETITNKGIVELGQTEQMEVIAEIYKTDIGKVSLGQQAIITSDAFPEQLQGTVTQIGLQVKQQNVFSNVPGADVDRKVVEVNISLEPEDSKRVEGLTHLQVQVAIQL